MFAILALSLTFASCADSTDTDDENPSPALPANVGENPITKTIKLKESESSSSYLELKTDGTARYVDNNETGMTYKYSYDDKKETITMKIEKCSCYVRFGEGELLLSYDDICSKINEEYTVENARKDRKEYYEKEKDYDIKRDYPNCNSYEDYEEAFVKENGFDSFATLVEYEKQRNKNYYKALFGAQITYVYKSDGGRMTLIEKFTGIKNGSGCVFENESGYVYITVLDAYIGLDDGRYEGDVNTDKKTISFKSEDGNGEKVNATYTENIDAGTVTINFKGNKYVCEFDGAKYTQVE